MNLCNYSRLEEIPQRTLMPGSINTASAANYSILKFTLKRSTILNSKIVLDVCSSQNRIGDMCTLLSLDQHQRQAKLWFSKSLKAPQFWMSCCYLSCGNACSRELGLHHQLYGCRASTLPVVGTLVETLVYERHHKEIERYQCKPCLI